MSTHIYEFRPIVLTVEGVGPFQGQPFQFELTDGDGDPANLYVIVGVNGLGKTTVLESIGFLISLLEGDDPARVDEPAWLRDHEDARLQLDLLVEMDDGERSRGVLSLVATKDSTRAQPELRTWLSQDLERHDATWWVQDGFVSPSGLRDRYRVALRPDGEVDAQALRHLDALREHIRGAREARWRSDLAQPTEDAPSVLFFTANRDLMCAAPTAERSLSRPVDWSHALVHRFDSEQGLWSRSLDHLLVWLDYVDAEARARGLGPDRFARACEIVNRHVFADPNEGPTKRLVRVDRERMEAVVEVNYGPDRGGVREHRIDRLSGGERSVAQIFVRVGAHMTLNTIMLIDEADIHLHPAWEREMMWALKGLAREHPGLTIILTTHSMDMLKIYDIHRQETDLRKGGYILDTREFTTGRETMEEVTNG